MKLHHWIFAGFFFWLGFKVSDWMHEKQLTDRSFMGWIFGEGQFSIVSLWSDNSLVSAGSNNSTVSAASLADYTSVCTKK